MQVEIKLDAGCKEPKVVILTDRVTDEVTAVLKRISEDGPQILSGFKDGALEVLDPSEVCRVYALDGKVFAQTDRGEYTLRARLYELEARLGPHQFVRISNSEIVNLRKVRKFDLSLTGTICVSLSNGAVTYVSRRYVSKLKKILGS